MKWNTFFSEFLSDLSPSDTDTLLVLNKKNYSGPSLKLLTYRGDLWVCIMSMQATDTANSEERLKKEENTLLIFC